MSKHYYHQKAVKRRGQVIAWCGLTIPADEYWDCYYVLPGLRGWYLCPSCKAAKKAGRKP